ncbi:hypothetical protein V2J09_003897 [Rumex salicifolius]
MSSLILEPLLHHNPRHPIPKINQFSASSSSSSSSKHLKISGSIRSFRLRRRFLPVIASAITAVPVSESGEIVYSETFKLKRTKIVEGKIYVKIDQGKKEDQWKMVVGCTLPGKWILHWGVQFIGDVGSEWDQPPRAMRPSGSISIKDYAIETPFKAVDVTEGECLHEVKIDFNSNCPIAAINFVLRDEETGSWYQHNRKDFKVFIVDYLHDGAKKKGFSYWTDALGHLSSILVKPEDTKLKNKSSSEVSTETSQSEKPHGFYEEQHVVKEFFLENSVDVSIRKSDETAKKTVCLETDLPGDVVVHWGVCKDNQKKWEIPDSSYSQYTETFKNKALRTRLQPKEEGNGNRGYFTLEENLAGFLFVLKVDDSTWLNNMGGDFFVPLTQSKLIQTENGNSDDIGVVIPSVRMEDGELDGKGVDESALQPKSTNMPKTIQEEKQESSDTTYANGIIKNIRSLVSDISLKKKWIRKSSVSQENLLSEIEKLAAEAYSIFRTTLPAAEEAVMEPEEQLPEIKVSSGTGTGYEILCQGFNWESHKSGKWYLELQAKMKDLASLGFTIIWLPPPTDSVSPEGYMPRDLYNLDSRYGTTDELKTVIKQFHEVGIKVLGDVVLNHRCAQQQNSNGVWNIFGGRLNWDDRAVVADDPHFQGRGNKSSGDNFHAAPNIDHSQDFVRNDIKEWMRWLKDDIGYDGWRLDFVRGFWGGYVKDYMDATVPYFAVGEYWDSLSYKYGEMEYNQDVHRQRIVDWINAAGGTAGAFDVTTKGILHTTLEKCQYWRLTDSKGKPPGVVGWWPSRAVTFIENHDTGSTQGHWRFPEGKEMQGYAYILTHPGTPSVFYDHIYSHFGSEIRTLMSLRTRNKLHCRSNVIINKAEKDVYGAVIDDKVAMKIGPGHYNPPSERNWSVAAEGNGYKIWEVVQ